MSSAFESSVNSGEFEWTATMYNLNSGKNEELLSKCKVLSECIQNGILADYLRGHRAEVIAMILTEFDEEAYRKGIFEEGHKEGLKQGLKQGLEQGIEQGIEQGLSQGRLDMLLSLVKDGSLTVENASAKLNVSVEEFEKLMSVK